MSTSTTLESEQTNSQNSSPPIYLILGPTAIGKSAYAIDLALKHNGEIISADAFQVYRGMDIGTAKVSKEELANIPHHLIDIKDPNEDYNVSEFVERCNTHITDIQKRGKTAIICGGTGFYIHSFLHNFTFIDESDNSKDIRNALNDRVKTEGLDILFNELKKIDPELASQLSPNDRKRIVRGLEVFQLTGQPASTFRKQDDQPRDDVRLIGLTSERETIYNRIEKRVDIMIQDGLIEEVEGLLERFGSRCLAFNALGYKETISYLNGIMDKETMVTTIKTKTRQFAKRQLTWFKRYQHAQWITIS